jgi:hypothetical protein
VTTSSLPANWTVQVPLCALSYSSQEAYPFLLPTRNDVFFFLLYMVRTTSIEDFLTSSTVSFLSLVVTDANNVFDNKTNNMNVDMAVFIILNPPNICIF